MKAAASPFYPPRAGRSRYLYKALDGIRRCLHRSQIGQNLSVDYPPAGFLKNCLVPGFGFRVAGWDRLARAGLTCWLVALVIYFLWIGRGMATVALALLLSIHASSILCAVSRAWPQCLLLTRLLIAATVVISLNQFVYGPVLSVVARSAILPIWYQDGFYVINRTPWGRDLRRGDLVAYRIHAQSGAARIMEGIGIDQVIGLPGDVIEFTRAELRINGAPYPKREGMPNAGRLALPRNYWFVWPTLQNTAMHGVVDASVISAATFAAGTVPRENILGKPSEFRLWRHQNQ